MEGDSIENTKKGTEKDNKRKTNKRNLNSTLKRTKEPPSNKVGVKVGDLVADDISEEKNIVQATTIDSDVIDAKQINTRALTGNARTYEMEKYEKNALIIFNHEIFKNEKHKTRFGTEHDVNALRNTFGKYGFDVVVHNNLPMEQVFIELETFSETNFTDYGCVAIAVLSHGKKDKLRAWDMAYSEVKILEYIDTSKNKTLVTKPRILIVQACRGEDPLDGVEVQPAETTQIDDDSDEGSYHLPREADLLILHSSCRGKASHRHTSKGSWFIQSLCKKVDELAATHDLISIVTEVQREVAVEMEHQKFNAIKVKLEYHKQIPEVKTYLTRKLYLKKYGDAAPPDFDQCEATISPPLFSTDDLVATVRFVIDVDDVTPGGIFSSQKFEILKLPWKLLVTRPTGTNDLCTGLIFNWDDNSGWSCRTEGEVMLFSHVTGVAPRRLAFNDEIASGLIGYWLPERWPGVFDPAAGYVHNNELTLEASVKAHPPQ